MFRSARLKLTAWYLLIVVCILFFFSLTAYLLVSVEIRRGLELQARSSYEKQLRIQRGEHGSLLREGSGESDREESDHERREREENEHEESEPSEYFEYDEELYDEEQSRILFALMALNIGIISASGGAAYFLADRTLKPIEAMMEEQKRFISDASHELRTPLTAMKTEIEVTLRDKNLSPEEAKEVLQSNLEEVDKLKALSDRLLTLGRLQDPNKNVEFAECNISEIGEEAIGQVITMASKKDIAVEFEPIVGKEAVIEGIQSNLLDTLVILLDNAIKYSRPNGKVRLIMIPHKESVTVIVEDNGIGISQEDLPNLFKRFYRADTARSRSEIEGYGLGLSIAKAFIDRHEGKIQVESRIDEGTRFILILPRNHKGEDRNGKITIKLT